MQNKANSSFLYFIYGFTILIAILFSLGMLSGVFQLINSPKEIHIPVKLNVDLENEGYMQYADKANIDITFSQIEGTVVYKEDNPINAPLAWVEILFPLARISLLLFIILLSSKVMQTSIKEEPFIDSNANRLQWMGYGFILMGLLKYIDGMVGMNILEEHLFSQYVTIDTTYSAREMGRFTGNLLSTEIPVGLFTLFIAALFKHGIAIRKENELTI